ncbi:MAG: ABC transporter substrate-binding protein [Acidimicrobiales bacterium]
MRWIRWIGAVLALSVLAGACSGSDGDTANADPGLLVVGLDDDPPGLDPAGNFLSVSALSVGNALYDSLMKAQPGAPPEPNLAESLVESEDRLGWTLTLRPGVSFHDGTPLDAAAAKANLDRQKASRLNAGSLDPLQEVIVEDDRTIALRLKVPWTALPAVLAGVQGMMLSPAAIKTAGANLARAPIGAGTGPYQFVEWVSDDHLTVKANPNYWGGPVGYEQITFRFLGDENARLAAFRAGDLQIMTAALSDTVRQAQDGADTGAVQAVRPPIAGQTVLYLNTAKAPFDDVRVRRAMLLALDLDALSEALGGEGYDQYSWSVLPKDSPWYVPPETPLEHNPDEARRLIEQYKAETGKDVAFTYSALSSSQTFADAGRAYAAAWAEVGINAKVANVADLTTLVLTMVLGQYDVAGLVAGYYADPDTVMFDLYHSNRTFNLSHYSNPEMDRLLEAARSEADPSVRRDLYGQVQQLAREEVPLLNGSFGTISLVADASVTGIEATGFFPARTVRPA